MDDNNYTVKKTDSQADYQAFLEAAGISKESQYFIDPDSMSKIKQVGFEFDEAAANFPKYKQQSLPVSLVLDQEPAGHENDSHGFADACTDGDVGLVKKMLEEGKDLPQTTEDGDSLLALACSAGYYDLVQIMLAMRTGCVDDRGTKNDCTPLMEAASAGHLDIVKLLIKYKAEVNSQSQIGNTPLHFCCANGHVDVCRELISHGALVEEQNENGHTPLMEAASNGHVEVAKLLLKSGAGINTHSHEFKESALTLACYKGHLDMVKFLLDAGADQEHKTDEMHTALMEACMDGHLEVARLLLNSGAQVNMPAESFESPLTLAACGGHMELASLLIANGANLEEVNDEGYTPLMEAAREGHDDMVMLLVQCGADVNAQTDETQETALTLAAYGGFADVVNFLLSSDADIEAGCSTALMEAAHQGHVALVSFLIEQGANVNAQTATGDTALTFACDNGHDDVADILLNKGAVLEHETECGRTPLMKAAAAGHFSTVQFLVSRGADINKISSKQDHTVLSLACNGGHLQVVELLLTHGADPSVKLKDNSTALIEAARQGQTQIACILIDYRMCESYPTQFPQSDLPVCSHEQDESRVPTNTLPVIVPPQAPDTSPALCSKTDVHVISETSRADRIKSKEEQMIRKDKILEEIQRVEKELNDRSLPIISSLNDLNLNTISKISKHNNQNNSYCINDVDVNKDFFNNLNSKDPLLPTPASQHNDASKKSTISPVRTKNQSTHITPQKNCLGACNDINSEKKSNFVKPHALSSNSALAENFFDRISKLPEEEQRKIMYLKDSLTSMISNPSSDFANILQSATQRQCLIHDTNGSSSHILPKNLSDCPQSTCHSSNYLDPQEHEVLMDVLTKRVSDIGHAVDFHTNRLSRDSMALYNSSVQCSEVDSAATSVTTSSSDAERTTAENANGVEIDACTDSNHDTALTLACSGGHTELVKELLLRGANHEHRDKKGFTPLILAATSGNAEIVTLLLDNNADIESQSERTKDTALSLACSGGRQEVVEILLNRGANKEHRNVSDYTPLSLAASGGCVAIIRLLLVKGAEINSRTGSKLGISPLMLAAMNGHVQAVKLLLEMGSDINAQIETNRNTALTLACFQGRHDVVSLLLDYKANVEHRAKTGLTPLMEAASGGYAEVGRVLLDRGADVNAPAVPSSRDTALTIAADKGHYNFCEVVVARGANVDAKNKKGQTALWLACNGGHLDVAMMLVMMCADVDTVDNKKVSALMAAFRKGHVKVLRYLVKKVTQFPGHQECMRYIATLSDKDLIKKCHQCMEIIGAAKDKQAAQANKNASILLQEIDEEKTREESKKAAAARKREKKKQKKKQQKKVESGFSGRNRWNNNDNIDNDETDEEYEVENKSNLGMTIRLVTTANPSSTCVPILSLATSTICQTNGQLKTTVSTSTSPTTHKQNSDRTSAGSPVSSSPTNVSLNPVTSSVTASNSKALLTTSSTADSATSEAMPANSTIVYRGKSPRKSQIRETGWKEVARTRSVTSKKTNVPATAISRVIGRAGCNINAIREGTGAHIEIDKQKSQTDRSVNIRGSPESVRLAEQLIDALICDPNVDIKELLPSRKVIPKSSTVCSLTSTVATTTCAQSIHKRNIPARPGVPVHVPAASVWNNPKDCNSEKALNDILHLVSQSKSVNVWSSQDNITSQPTSDPNSTPPNSTNALQFKNNDATCKSPVTLQSSKHNPISPPNKQQTSPSNSALKGNSSIKESSSNSPQSTSGSASPNGSVTTNGNINGSQEKRPVLLPRPIGTERAQKEKGKAFWTPTTLNSDENIGGIQQLQTMSFKAAPPSESLGTNHAFSDYISIDNFLLQPQQQQSPSQRTYSHIGLANGAATQPMYNFPPEMIQMGGLNSTRPPLQSFMPTVQQNGTAIIPPTREYSAYIPQQHMVPPAMFDSLNVSLPADQINELNQKQMWGVSWDPTM